MRENDEGYTEGMMYEGRVLKSIIIKYSKTYRPVVKGEWVMYKEM
jgi:hypothetical protein